MTRYWFEFDQEGNSIGLQFFGVTAYDYRDALNLLKSKAFSNGQMPKIKRIIEDIDVSTLDADHILPNMVSPSVRSIWYPLGFD